MPSPASFIVSRAIFLLIWSRAVISLADLSGVIELLLAAIIKSVWQPCSVTRTCRQLSASCKKPMICSSLNRYFISNLLNGLDWTQISRAIKMGDVGASRQILHLHALLANRQHKFSFNHVEPSRCIRYDISTFCIFAFIPKTCYSFARSLTTDRNKAD